jgi:hypothetical protein
MRRIFHTKCYYFQVHEKNCKISVPENCDTDQPRETILSKEEPNDLRFFSYLKLRPKDKNGKSDSGHRGSLIKRPRANTLAKFLSIDLTSPLGQYIFRNKRLESGDIDLVGLCAKTKRESKSSLTENGFPVTYPRWKINSQISHIYSFSPSQKWQRLVTIETGKEDILLEFHNHLPELP